jgi:diamine N-acetyltransferase
MSVTFRTPTIDDTERLAELGERAFTETFGHLYTPDNLALFLENHSPTKWREDLCDPNCAVCVGEVDGQPIAYAKLLPPDLPIEITAPAIEIKQFYVLNSWHGTGVANQLMDWAIEEARTRGAQELYLSVFTENERAQRFYARFGFEEVGRQKFMVGTHADEDIVMRRVM